MEIFDSLNTLPIDIDSYWNDKDKRRVFQESVRPEKVAILPNNRVQLSKKFPFMEL